MGYPPSQGYVDNSSFPVKQVRMATNAALPAVTRTGNILLADATGTWVGHASMDGLTPAVGDRILVKNQVTGANNGPYRFDVVGAVGVKAQLTRTTDADADTEMTTGIVIPVSEGTVAADKAYQLTTNAPITLNTTALTFSQLGGPPSGAVGGTDVTGTYPDALTLVNTALPKVCVHGADVASSGTIDLGAATGDLVDVTGTTTITAITLGNGLERTVRFTGALTLTHGSSLVLPGAANITTAAGDFAVFRGYASSVVRCVDYQKASGAAVVAPASTPDYSCSIGRTADVTVNLHTSYDIAFNDADRYDTDAMHDPAVNNTRITFTHAGLYSMSLWIAVTGDYLAVESVQARITRNSDSFILGLGTAGHGLGLEDGRADLMPTCSGRDRITAADYVTCLLNNFSPAAVTFNQAVFETGLTSL
jgi:hypothetical protein